MHPTSWLQTPDQATSCSLTVLPTDGSSSGNARAPSTRFAVRERYYLITAAELAAAGFPNGTSPTFLGWTYFAAPVTGGSAPLIIYMQNTTDTTNTKSSTWATAITGMTTVHSAVTALPGTDRALRHRASRAAHPSLIPVADFISRMTGAPMLVTSRQLLRSRATLPSLVGCRAPTPPAATVAAQQLPSRDTHQLLRSKQCRRPIREGLWRSASWARSSHKSIGGGGQPRL